MANFWNSRTLTYSVSYIPTTVSVCSSCSISICRKNEETNAKILERNDVPGCVLENNKPIKIPPYFSPHLALFPSPSISCQNSRHTGLSPALRLALPFPRSGLSQILHPIYNTLLPLCLATSGHCSTSSWNIFPSQPRQPQTASLWAFLAPCTSPSSNSLYYS